MGTIDLRRFDAEQIVIHYGGALRSVNAYTFANSLVAFADTIRTVNSAVNPGQSIEIRVEAIGPGSFRAVIRKVRKGIPGFLGRQIEGALGALVALLILNPLFEKDENTVTTVYEDRVEIRKGDDLIIVPRAAYNQLPNVQRNEEVQENIKKTIRVIENDEAIDNFGVTPALSDDTPEVQIDRDQFGILSSATEELRDQQKRRERRLLARLVILKPWLKSGARKWSFEWNGVPITAPIRDEDFQASIQSRKYLIGYGDAIDAVLRFYQDFDPNLGTFINDTTSFEVLEVKNFLPRGGGSPELNLD